MTMELQGKREGGRSSTPSSRPPQSGVRQSVRPKQLPLLDIGPPSAPGHEELLKRCRTISDEERALSRLLSSQGTADNLRHLFSQEIWGDYDETMDLHVQRIQTLLWELADLDKSGFWTPERRIFKKGARIADIGGGSGSIEEALINILRPEDPDLRFKIFDLSENMLSKARAKLATIGARFEAEFIAHDILEHGKPMLPLESGTQDIVLMSQALPFMFDRDAAKKESERGIYYLGAPHMVRRLEVVEEQIRTLKDGGHLIIIDEDPMLFTIATETPEQILRSRIFSASTRMVQLNQFLNGVMKNAAEKVRFVCQLDIPIDGHHRMYLMVYRKQARREALLPPRNGRNGRFPAEERHALRSNAADRLLDAMKKVNWWPMDDREPAIAVRGHTIRDGRVYDSRVGGIMEGQYDTVVLVEQLFRLQNGNRIAMIENAMNHVREGGSLVIIEDFEKERERQYPYPVQNSLFRETIMPRFGSNLSLVGALSAPVHEEVANAMIAYHYVKFGRI